MKTKKYFSLLLALIIFAAVLPVKVLAAEYYSLKDVAEANGYEYFYFSENNVVNIRSASYILSFQENNNKAGYKSVIGSEGSVILNNPVQGECENLYISKYDLQTKLVKYFSKLPNNEYSVNLGTDNTEPSEQKTQETDIQNGNEAVSKDKSIPSKWAIDEVYEAKAHGIITQNVSKNYQADITREYFCELVIKLYEKLTNNNTEAKPAGFTDTSNPDVLKAYNLGIVNGISKTEFAPENTITRQEICAMLVRCIDIAIYGANTNTYNAHEFADQNQIDYWAEGYINYAYDCNIIKGIENNRIDPKGKATCEQAVIMAYRIYNSRDKFLADNKIMVTFSEEVGEINGEIYSIREVPTCKILPVDTKGKEIGSFCYYNGYVYYILSDAGSSDYSTWLYRCKPDWTGEELLDTFISDSYNETGYRHFVIDNNVLYYDNNNGCYEVTRINLSNLSKSRSNMPQYSVIDNGIEYSRGASNQYDIAVYNDQYYYRDSNGSIYKINGEEKILLAEDAYIDGGVAGEYLYYARYNWIADSNAYLLRTSIYGGNEEIIDSCLPAGGSGPYFCW